MGGITLSGTGGSRHGGLVIMAQLGDSLGVTVRAAGAGVGPHAVSGTGGSLGHRGGIAVTQSGLLITVVAVAAGAGIHGVALGGAGGCHHSTRGISVGMGVGDDQHVGIIDKGEVIGTTGGDQRTVAAPIRKLPANGGGGGGGIPNFAVVTQPGAVLDHLELIGTGRQLDTIGIAAAAIGHVGSGPAVEIAVDANDLGIAAVCALTSGVAVADGRDTLGIAVRAAGAGIGPDTGSGTGSRRGHLGTVAVTQSGAGGVTAGTGLGLGTGSRRIAMGQLVDGGIPGESTIGGGLPGPLIGTCGCTGSRRGGGSGVIRGVQLGHRHCIGVGAAGAGTLNGTRSGSGGVHIFSIIGVIMAQGAAGGGAAGAGLGLGTGSCRIAVGSLGNGGSISKCTVGGGLPLPGISTGSGTGCRLGGGSCIVGGIQSRQRHRVGSRAAGALALDGACGAGGGRCHRGVIGVVMTQSGAGGGTAGATGGRRAAGCIAVAVTLGRNGGCISKCTVGFGIPGP